MCLSLSACLALAGCAYKYVDSEGDERVVGFVNMKTRPAAASGPHAGTVVDLQVLGLGISRTAQGGSLILGYSREVTAQIKDNALVVGNPLKIGGARD